MARHFDLGRVGQEGVGDPFNLGCHCRTEKQRLASEWRQFEDAFDIGNEPHVQHTVGFINHHDLHAAQQELAAFEMVQQAAGRCDQHVNAAVDEFILFAKCHAANQQRLGQLGVLGVGFEILGHLGCQFARGCQHKAARHACPRAALTQ